MLRSVKREAELTDAEDDEEDDVDDELTKSRLDYQFLVSFSLLRLLRRPDGCMQ